MEGLMRHVADVYVPTLGLDESGGQVIESYRRVARNVGCFVQPSTSKVEYFNDQRGLEDEVSIFTTRQRDWSRNELLEHEGKDYHIVGVRQMLSVGGPGYELICHCYPSPAQKMLDREDYAE